MRTYKITKGNVGPWAEGEVITDDDLKANPGMGGAKRLMDELGVIDFVSETPDALADDANPAPVGQFLEVKGKGASPNAAGHGKRGKS